MPLCTVRLCILVAFEVTRVMQLPWHSDFILAKFVTSFVSGSDDADCSGEWPFCALNKLLLNRVNKALIVFSVFICGHEGVNTAPHGVLEEVPRVCLLEAGHTEDILRLFAISEELDGEGREQSLGILMQVGRLREANDVVVRLETVESSIVMVADRDPRNLRDKPLLVSSLFASLGQLIRILAEGAIGFSCEYLTELCPKGCDHGSVLSYHGPKIIHLLGSWFILKLV